MTLLDRAVRFLDADLPPGTEVDQLARDLRCVSSARDLPEPLALCARTAAGHVELVTIARASHFTCGDAEHTARLSAHIRNTTRKFQGTGATIRGAA
jgi:hypothetical protein